jgi:hypothetical protein
VSSFQGAPPIPTGDTSPSVSELVNETPKTALRVYTLDEGDWQVLDALGAVLMNINPFVELINKIDAVTPVKFWKWFRCDGIKFKLTVPSPSNFTGLLVVSAPPFYRPTSVRNDMSYFLQTDHFFVDSSQGDSYEFTMPFLVVDNMINVSQNWTCLGEICMFVMDPLHNDLNSTGAEKIHWRLEAAFVNPVFSGPQPGTGSPPTTITFLPLSVLDPPTFLYQAQENPMKKEAQSKSRTGLISGPAEAVGTVAAMLTPIPIIGEAAAAVSVIATTVSKVASWFGFSKPLSQERPVMNVSVTGSAFNHARGLMPGTALSRDPDPLVATESALLRGTGDELALSHIRSIKSMVYAGVTNSSFGPGTRIFSMPVNPAKGYLFGSNIMPNHLMHAAMCFDKWRGSLKYLFRFNASPLRKMRIAIIWSPDQMAIYDENVKRMEVSTSGSTTIEYVVPWNVPSKYLPFRTPTSNTSNYGMSNGWISMWILESVVVNGLSTITSQYFDIHQVGGEDLEFAGSALLSSPTAGITSDPSVVPLATATFQIPATRDLKAQGIMGTRIRGVTGEDTFDNLRELMHITTYRDVITVDTPILLPVLGESKSLFCWIRSKFLFWRGSIDISIRKKTGTATFIRCWRDTVSNANDTTFTGTSPIVFLDSSQNHVVTMKVPHLSVNDCIRNTTYEDLPYSFLAPPAIRCDTANTAEVYEAAGDDFSLAIAVPSRLYTPL